MNPWTTQDSSINVADRKDDTDHKVTIYDIDVLWQ